MNKCIVVFALGHNGGRGGGVGGAAEEARPSKRVRHNNNQRMRGASILCGCCVCALSFVCGLFGDCAGWPREQLRWLPHLTGCFRPLSWEWLPEWQETASGHVQFVLCTV